MRRISSLALAIVALATSVAVARAQDPAPPALRLPEGARPLGYVLTLTIVPGQDKVAGEMVIDVSLDRPHAVVWLNADALTVIRATSAAPAARARVIAGHDQFVGLAWDPPLPAGRHRLTLVYEAEQSKNSTRGIFTLEEGGAWYAMTHFEPTSARRAFPCFDEPGYKVPWQITLNVPRGAVALSNTFVAEERDGEEGMKRVRFRTTRPLPSYLIAFAVGPWETVGAGRLGLRPTPMRVVTPRGRKADAAFAASAFPALFGEAERWFGIAHPFEKLDHIAIPLTVRFAMENAGLITYGMPTLLAKRGDVSARFRHQAANLGAHEIAHQWFGNLVSPAWWDDLWLNESFATWFAEKIVDRWQPSYERGAARVHDRADAIAEDALASARRIREPIVAHGDIRNAFDSITYQKGATVVGMFENWIGERPFQRGVQAFLKSRRDGNATATDFLDALAKASRLPVTPAFASFLDQNGVPQVAVDLDCSVAGKPVLKLTQARHRPVGAASGSPSRWQIPICVRYWDGAAERRTCTLLSEPMATLPLRGACPSYVFANPGGRGYYLPEYRGDLLERLARHRDALSVPETASLVYDLRALLRAGAVDAGVALDWLRATAMSRDRHVLLAAIDLAQFVRDTLVGEAEQAKFAELVRDVFGQRMRALGLVSRPGESDDDALLRRSLVRFAAPFDPASAGEARRLSLAWLDDRSAIEAGLVDAVLQVAALDADAAFFEALEREARRTSDRLDRSHLLMALLSFREPSLSQRGLNLLLDPGFDIREIGDAWWAAQYTAPPRRADHAFVEANLDGLAARVQRDTPGGWPSHAARLCSDADRDQVAAFWRDRIGRYAGGAHVLAQSLEAIMLCARLREAQQPGLRVYLSRSGGN